MTGRAGMTSADRDSFMPARLDLRCRAGDVPAVSGAAPDEAAAVDKLYAERMSGNPLYRVNRRIRAVCGPGSAVPDRAAKAIRADRRTRRSCSPSARGAGRRSGRTSAADIHSPTTGKRHE
jgi:hypothetical protein